MWTEFYLICFLHLAKPSKTGTEPTWIDLILGEYITKKNPKSGAIQPKDVTVLGFMTHVTTLVSGNFVGMY